MSSKKKKDYAGKYAGICSQLCDLDDCVVNALEFRGASKGEEEERRAMKVLTRWQRAKQAAKMKSENK